MYSIIPKQLGGFLVKFKLECLPSIHSLSGRISRKGLTFHPHPSGLGGNNRSERWAHSKKLSKLGSQPQWLQRRSVFLNLPTSYRSLLFSWPESGCQFCLGEGRLPLTGEGRGWGVRPTNSMELGGQSKPPSPALYQDKASILASISLSPEDCQGPSLEVCHQRMCKELHKGNRSENGDSRSGTEGSV